jgi:SAM-dependent methyltransferase
VEELPFEASSFVKVCTVNTIYFWKSLDSAFAEIHRVLSPGGWLIVGFPPKERMDRMRIPTDIFTTRAPDEVDAALRKAGLTNVHFDRPEPTTPWNVVVATRS